MLERRGLRLVHPESWTNVTLGAILGLMKFPLAPVDPLGEALHFLRMTGFCPATRNSRPRGRSRSLHSMTV